LIRFGPDGHLTDMGDTGVLIAPTAVPDTVVGQSAPGAATANEAGQSARRAATANEAGQSARRAATANETAPEESADSRMRALVDAHYEFVWRSLRRFGIRDGEVDDAVQKVFWVACRKLPSIKDGSERAFLFQTALRVAADVRRAERRNREVVGAEADDVLDPRPGPEDLIDRHRARLLLDRVLDDMALEQRAVFVLFEVEQMTLVEIAALLGIPRGTVASRLRKARSEFYERVSRFVDIRPGERT
jgi:RNA polymerase sigma-70 factor (ECF subfamily)